MICRKDVDVDVAKMSMSAPLLRLFRQNCGAQIDISRHRHRFDIFSTNHLSLRTVESALADPELRSKRPREGPFTHPLQRGRWAGSAFGGRFRTQPGLLSLFPTCVALLGGAPFRGGVQTESIRFSHEGKFSSPLPSAKRVVDITKITSIDRNSM